MTSQPQESSIARAFLGLFLQPDPHDIPDGAAADMENVRVESDGRLVVRSGDRPLIFDE